ncbi:hypothetical protein ACLMJK_008561 [Lecanora helva]
MSRLTALPCESVELASEEVAAIRVANRATLHDLAPIPGFNQRLVQDVELCLLEVVLLVVSEEALPVVWADHVPLHVTSVEAQTIMPAIVKRKL